METIAKFLGTFLLAVAGLAGVYAALAFSQQDSMAVLFSLVVAAVFALPGFLLASYASTADRRLRASRLVQERERFTIDDVAAVLRSSPELAHAFIAEQISRQGLQLDYVKEVRGYARRGLPGTRPPPPPPAPVSPVAAAGPCPTCGSTQAPTETGFCPSCGTRAQDPGVRV